MSEVARLLRVVVEGTQVELARALHPRATLARADGATIVGRSAIMEALRGDDGGAARYAVRGACDDALAVELTVAGVPGALRFTLRGELSGERLVAIRVEA